MALIFELVINAGPDRAAAEQVAEQLADLRPLRAGRHRVSLVPPQIRAVQGEDGADYQEVSVAAAGVGHQPVLDAAGEQLPLDDDELSELADGLYEVLRGCQGYRAAFVGFNPEFLVDIAGLEQDWPRICRPVAACPGSC